MGVLPLLGMFSYLEKIIFIPLQWICMLNRLAFSGILHCI